VSPRSNARLQLVAIPLAAYTGETIVIPALNGAIARPGFWEHAAITAGVSLAIAAIWVLMPFVWSKPKRPQCERS
jgi:hypothetical protein